MAFSKEYVLLEAFFMNYILRFLHKLDSDTAQEYTLSIKLFVYQRM